MIHRSGWRSTVMRRGCWHWYLIAAVAAAGLWLGGCGGQETATPADDRGEPAAGATQTDDQGQVTVKVTWTSRHGGAMFTVVMDTHSVDLDEVDLRDRALLRTSDGREAYPVTWDAPKGGHHREGTLTFPAQTADGHPLITDATESITLTLMQIAGVAARSFRWSLPAAAR